MSDFRFFYTEISYYFFLNFFFSAKCQLLIIDYKKTISALFRSFSSQSAMAFL